MWALSLSKCKLKHITPLGKSLLDFPYTQHKCPMLSRPLMYQSSEKLLMASSSYLTLILLMVGDPTRHNTSSPLLDFLFSLPRTLSPSCLPSLHSPTLKIGHHFLFTILGICHHLIYSTFLWILFTICVSK